jgi:hypothetical protein
MPTLEVVYGCRNFKENIVSIGAITLILLILVLVGTLPTWSYSNNWGYGPTGGVGLLVIILLVLLLTGRM